MRRDFGLFAAGALAGIAAAWLLVATTAREDDAAFDERSVAATVASGSVVPPMTRRNSELVPSSTTSVASDYWRTLVEQDGGDALAAALAVSGRADRRRAVILVGQLWAQIDPEMALLAATTLPLELVAEFNASVASEWANLDSAAFLEFAEQTADLDALVAGLELLIATDPERIYEIADRLTSASDFAVATLMHDVQRDALHAVADRDSTTAMRLIDPWLSRIDSSPLPQEVITRFARSDPDAALAWLESLDAVTNTHRRAVLEGIAQVSFFRAFEYAATIPGIHSDIQFSFARGALSDTTQTADIASMLLNHDSQLASAVLQELVGTWAARDPDMLVNWMLTNAGALDASSTRSIAWRFAATDLESAMSLLDRVPPHLSDVWVAEVAAQYASQEPSAALDWIQQFQGQSLYDDLHARVVMNTVNSDPDLASAMLGELTPPLSTTAASAIARALVERDPLAAADWASGLEDPATAASAVSDVLRGWVQRDVTAARRWALNLARGEFRDRALYGLVSGSYATNLDPIPILDEIEDESTRKMAQSAAIGNISSTRPAVARALAEELLGDPLYDEYARRTLEWLD